MKNSNVEVLRNTLTEADIAKRNIETKISILNNWLNEGLPYNYDESGNYIRDNNGEKTLDHIPTSINAFLKWNGTQNCGKTKIILAKKYSQIRGTGQNTLEQYDDLYEQVKIIVSNIKEKLNSNKKSKVKSNIIDGLESEIAILTKAKEITEIRYRQQLQKINKLSSLLNDEKAAHESTKSIWSSDVERRDNEISSLVNENRKLTNILNKVTPLKKV